MRSKKRCERKRFRSREEWLKGRQESIGASEAAAVIGQSAWTTPTELWQQKVFGMFKDFSGNEAIAKGVRLEPYLRELFKGLHPEYKVEYHPFDLLYQKERPWLTATLDGELIDSGKKRSVLEIKTSTPMSRKAWDEWNDRTPNTYWCQCCHQLLATGYQSVILFACLFGQNGDITIREYLIDRNDERVQKDMEYLLEKETEFWGFVQAKQLPKLSITF